MLKYHEMVAYAILIVLILVLFYIEPRLLIVPIVLGGLLLTQKVVSGGGDDTVFEIVEITLDNEDKYDRFVGDDIKALREQYVPKYLKGLKDFWGLMDGIDDISYDKKDAMFNRFMKKRRFLLKYTGIEQERLLIVGSTTTKKILNQHWNYQRNHENGTKKVYFVSATTNGKIEMFMTVTTADDSPVFSHMGINRSYQYLLDESKPEIHRGLSMKLHKFAAQKMSELFDNKKYMISSPVGSMSKIMEASGIKVWYDDRSFNDEHVDADRLIINTNGILKIRSPDDINYTNPLLELHHGKGSVSSVKINGNDININDYDWLIKGDLNKMPMIAIDINSLLES